MNKKIPALLIILCFIVLYVDITSAQQNNLLNIFEKSIRYGVQNSGEDYGIQWEMNFGSDSRSDARYEGPQPIGDCNNDGKNELLIGGRDNLLRIYTWNDATKTYEQTQALHNPLYPFIKMDSDGFAIGDLTGDGKNEIAVSWYAAVYSWTGIRYKLIGWNPWVEWHGGGTPDCYIGDCDNDGKNELIVSGGSFSKDAPEITIFKWNGWRLVKTAQWDDPGVNGYVYMAGVGDVDYDGENEIVCGSENKVVVLDWNKQSKAFNATIIETTGGWENYPFACICKDSDMDGKAEIHVGYYSPHISIFKWNGTNYGKIFEKIWPGEDPIIEGLDVGDVNDDGIAEVCAGTNLIHILQWNGTTYVEQAVLPTFGTLAVVAVGDCDNDGKNEINAGSVIVNQGQDYMEWVFKYGWEDSK